MNRHTHHQQENHSTGKISGNRMRQVKSMIRPAVFSMLMIGLVCLSGCQRAPTVTNDGMAWSPDWVRIGTTMGVETPGNALVLLDNKDALSAAGLYYATWVIGERTEYVNAEEETVDLYDAQLYVLLADCKNEAAAEQDVTEWQTTEESTYTVKDIQTITCASQDFTVLTYEVSNENNPYSYGVSAFGVYQNHAINAELSCRDTYTGNALAVLTEFLNGIHYA